MVLCRGARLKKPDMTKLPFILNMVLIALGVFILLAMSVVWIIFEEFTAFTDYTQQWIEFNFFILYWDKLTISRTYLSFMMIYGAIILLSNLRISFYQVLKDFTHRNFNFSRRISTARPEETRSECTALSAVAASFRSNHFSAWRNRVAYHYCR